MWLEGTKEGRKEGRKVQSASRTARTNNAGSEQNSGHARGRTRGLPPQWRWRNRSSAFRFTALSFVRSVPMKDRR